jgi:solute carrier family 35 protein E3
LLSGFLAFLVNLSIYWIIGTTSALTYNMVGYLKFNLIVGFGIFLFNDPIKFQQVLAILMLLIGFL